MPQSRSRSLCAAQTEQVQLSGSASTLPSETGLVFLHYISFNMNHPELVDLLLVSRVGESLPSLPLLQS